MPVAMKQFLLENRVLQPGEVFELPAGVALAALQADGLVEAEAVPPEPVSPKRRRRRAEPAVQTAD